MRITIVTLFRADSALTFVGAFEGDVWDLEVELPVGLTGPDLVDLAWVRYQQANNAANGDRGDVTLLRDGIYGTEEIDGETVDFVSGLDGDGMRGPANEVTVAVSYGDHAAETYARQVNGDEEDES